MCRKSRIGEGMNIEQILQKVDECYENNRGAEAESIMREAIALAVQEQDDESLLQLLNELLGYYRETSQVENSFAIAEQAVALAKRMGLEQTIPYATTLLNVANAYRAGGKLEDSRKCYLTVREIYEKILAPDNMLVASLENNMSLLYQEMGNFVDAKNCLLKALDIVTAKKADFEVAVTYANLASTCMQLHQEEDAFAYSEQAIIGFEKLGVADAHYGAALSARGTYYFQKRDYEAAKSCFQKAMTIMEENLGRNEYYERLQENVKACEKELTVAHEYVRTDSQDFVTGLALCREYYEKVGNPMLLEKFPKYLDKIAVGLVGEGSDCFGYDDAFSRDHDWGPDFCMWVSEETYQEIGEDLQREYEKLPREWKGYKRTRSPQGYDRRGVITISGFYNRLLQADEPEKIDWRQVSDASLAAMVKGEVFRDTEGIFSDFRQKLSQGYPEWVRYLKMAESAAKFSQCGQYNYARMLQRGDLVTAGILWMDGIREAMKLQHYIENRFPPHDKWLYRSLQESEQGHRLAAMISGGEPTAERMEEIGEFLAAELYQNHFISDIDSYLDAHTGELLYKASVADKRKEELVEQIARLEFEAFDKVQNVGGRAFCQNDWATFSIMRKSQYLTWSHTMLLQHLYDFDREYRKGHNLITEKYGRMMESTAPEEYEQLKQYFPAISEEKKAIIEQIVQMQVAWMEEFSAKYPHLADNARSVRSAEDNLYNTSYETYLRGEISTYSDKMLELYGRYVVEHAVENKNLAFEIMEHNVHLYGYADLDAAEHFLAL